MENRIAKLEEFAADAKIRLTRIEAVLDQNGGRFDQDIATSIVVYAQQPGPTAAANPPVTTLSAPALPPIRR